MSDENPEDPLVQLAAAVTEGSQVDWAGAESSAVTSEQQVLIRELQVVANLATVHRQLTEQRPSIPTVADTPVPKTWGGLELRRIIGQGSFGTVYLAWDPTLEREVALKILRDAERSATVIQEGRLLARVRHPNVVTIYGVDQYDGAVGLWMELVEGLTVRQVLGARGSFSAQEAALIGIDLCRALAAVHKAGVVHRDIKAQNVMREVGGRIVLMDFGAGEIRSDRTASIRPVAGTPLYLAPELFDGGPATIASDIYSLGVLMYHLVTQTFPIEGETTDAVALAHVRGECTRLADARPDLPGAFVRVVERALERDPALRYRSSGALQQELVGILDVDTTSTASKGRTASTPRRPHGRSLAVLPFDNLGPDRDIEYFCDGLAEELLTGLARVPGLRMASRTSSFGITRTGTHIKTICQQLDVDAVLEGTVRKSGDRVRITAQLVSADDGCHLWSEGYDRRMEDVFTVQDEIARSVVDSLKIVLTDAPRRPIIRQQTESPRAYECYLKGRFYWQRRHQGGLARALEYFQRAIEEDAGYALAHAGLADAYAIIGMYSIQVPRTAFGQAAVEAQRALAIDPDLAEAHASLALSRLGTCDWSEAEHAFSRALELDSSLAMARLYLSWMLALMGDSASAISQVRAAQESEPLSPMVNAAAAHTWFFLRRYDEALAQCEKCLEVDPHFIFGLHMKGMSLAQLSRLPEAIEVGERTTVMSDRAPFYLGVLGHYYARTGETNKVQAIIEELARLTGTRYVPPHCLAFIYAALNDFDRAFEWQARAHDDGAPPFYYCSPLIENLHVDPRHTAELRRMGLLAGQR